MNIIISTQANRILREINFDFTTFTMDKFLNAVAQKKAREIITLAWNMPTAMFGAWISDEEKPREYIFYRHNVSEAHQVHIQLHELSHFLFGHQTIKINSQLITDAVVGKAEMPFELLPQRSPRVTSLEIEAETLTNLIQELAIRNSKMSNLLMRGASLSEERLASFVGKMSLP